MADQKRQPTAESHQSVEITLRRTMTRKNPQTGKSNYPTVSTMRSTTTNYIKNAKRIIERNYRKIIPSDND